MDAHAPQKNNTLNTIGIITVGVVGSVFVYVSIVALMALYVSETSPVATMKAFGAQGEIKDSLKAEQVGNITEPRIKGVFGPANTQLYGIGIEAAKALIIRDSADPSRFVPAIGASTKPTIAPAFGRPQPLAVPPPPPAPVTGDAPPPVPATGDAPAPVPATGAAPPPVPATGAAPPPAAGTPPTPAPAPASAAGAGGATGAMPTR